MLWERINILLIIKGRNSFVTICLVTVVGEFEIVLLPPLGSFQLQTLSSELYIHVPKALPNKSHKDLKSLQPKPVTKGNAPWKVREH